MNLTERQRAYAYRVAASVGALLVAYGFISEQDLAQWLGLAGAILALSGDVLASANTSTKPQSDIPTFTHWQDEG